MDTLHILVVTQGLCEKHGGAEASLLALISHLATSHRVTVVNGDANTAEIPSLPSCVAYIPFEMQVCTVPGRWFNGTRSLARRIYWVDKFHEYVRSIERVIIPTLLISQKPPFPYISSRTSTIGFVRDLEFITYFGGEGLSDFSLRYYLKRYWGWRMLYALRQMTQVVANSRYTQSVLSRHKIKSLVIPPFIEASGELPPAATGRNGNILFLSANLAAHKGVRVLIELANRMPHRRFQAVGQDTEGYAAMLPSNVDWQPWLDTPQHALQKAAMLIVPSQCPETFGRVVVEAQRFGVPVIASHVGGLPEAVGAGGCLIRPPDHIEAWQEAIESLYCDGQRYESLRRRALLDSKRFDSDRTLGQFDDMLCKLVSGA